MEQLAYFGNYSITGLEPVNIATLYNQRRWNELDSILISEDEYGAPNSIFRDDTWDLSIYHHRLTSKAETQIKFGHIKNPSIKLEAKLACYGMSHFPVGYKGLLKVYTLTSFSNNIIRLVCFLENKGVKSLTELNYSLFVEIFTELGKTLSHNSIYQKIIAVNKVHLLAQKIGFLVPVYIPKPSHESRKYAAENKKIIRQFAALPTNVLISFTNYLINQIEVIDFYLPTLLELLENCKQVADERNSAAENYKYKAETYKLRNPLYVHYQAIMDKALNGTPLGRFFAFDETRISFHPLLTLHKIITWCNQVCFFTCIAFTGMRRSDAFELRPDSYSDFILSDGTRVSVLCGKTHKMAGIVGKDEIWVTAEVVKKAINIASILSLKGREEALENLENFPHIKNRKKWERISRSIWLGYKGEVTQRLFTDFNYLNEDWDYRITPEDLKEHQVLTPYPVNENYEIGGRWPLSPHQLRRSLIVFAIRYDLATVPAFKQQYKHLCASMTRHYARQAGAAAWLDIANGSSSRRELVDALQREKYEQQAGIDYELHKNEAKLYGKGGENILRMRESGALPLIYRSKEDVLKAHKSGRISLHRTFIGWCNAGYQCNMKSIFDVTGCYQHKCEHLIMTESDKESLKRMHKSLQNTFVELKDEQQKSSYFTFPIISEIRALEHVMTELCVDHEKWQQPEAILHE